MSTAEWQGEDIYDHSSSSSHNAVYRVDSDQSDNDVQNVQGGDNLGAPYEHIRTLMS